MAGCGILLNDGNSFILLNSGGFLLLNDESCSSEPGTEATGGSGAPPIRGAWLKWWETAKAFEALMDNPKSENPELSPEQMRLIRKLKMYEEMLFDASDHEARRIEVKIRQLREKIGAS